MVEINSKEEKAREALYEEKINDIRSVAGDVAADACRKILSLFGSHTYKWYAGLWDSRIGAFYYSNSGRDTEGYLPDIESTVQAVSHLMSGGMFEEFEDGYIGGLPEGMKKKIVAFAKGLQSAEDGFFYHPQWKTVGESRRGRDLWWATKIIKEFGDVPLYDTPNGYKGALGAPRCIPSGEDKKEKVVQCSVEHLSSLEKWAEYLENLKINENSYSAGNLLGAITEQIINAGSEYVDYLVEFLFSHQYSHNGLWEKELTYRSVNGLMKVLQTLNGIGVSAPYKDEALQSCIAVAISKELTEGNVHVCSVYNPFVAINYLLMDVKAHEGEGAVLEMRKKIKPYIGALLDTTYEKMCIFKKDDGGFSYYRYGSSSTSQGAPVAVPGTAESDVNATGIMYGTFRNIFEVLALPPVQIYTAADMKCFFELIGE